MKPGPLVLTVLAVAGLALLTAACGGSPRSQVAQLGSTTTASSPSGGAATGRSPTSRPLAFSHCMRSHGFPNWHDPVVDDQGRGSFDTQAAGIDTSSPQIRAEVHDCDHVFPASIGIPWAP